MKLALEHSWKLTPREAMALQTSLRERVIDDWAPDWKAVETVAGLDVCYSKATDMCYAAVVVMRLRDLQIIEESTAAMASPFPYVPGLLSFREAPPLIVALERLSVRPDVLLLDAHGRAHPRGMGLACHIGLLYDCPSVGCAKSLLCGAHEVPPFRRGAWRALRDEKTGAMIGSVLRTRPGVKPVYVSVGHRVTGAFARRLVLATAPRFRLPEPTRRAHTLSNEERRRHEIPK